MKLTAGFVLWMFACANEPTRSEVVAGVGGDNAGEHDQGRHLLGSSADNWQANGRHLSIQTTITGPNGDTVTLSANGGALVAKVGGTPRPLGGLSIPTSPLAAAGKVEITASGAGDQYDFIDNAGNRSAYCDDGSTPIATSGYWQTDGRHMANSNAITLSCANGVLTKCFTWGYHPPATETTGTATDPWTVHQACTYMARADYCAEGVPHTYDETSIVVRDRFPNVGDPEIDDPNVPRLRMATTHPTPPDRFWFESAWNGGGVSGRLGAACQSRDRWASQPLGGYCPTKLPDPRVDPSGVFCEDLGNDVIDVAILYNASMIGEMYLNRWANAAGEQLVTIRGMYRANGNHEPPYPGYKFYRGEVGLLMRNPPHSLSIGTPPDANSGDLLEVDSLYDSGTGDRVVTFPGPATTSEFEGYVYSAWATGRLELHLWFYGNDRVTAVDDPSTLLRRYRDGGVIGWIDPPETP